jgi:putative transposase
MVDPGHSQLSLTAQCRLLAISRSGWYAERQGESADTQQLLRIIDAQFLETPYYGSRQMTRWLHRQGYQIGRHRVRRLMRVLGIEAIYQKPRTSHPHPHHKIYPYLLKGLTIDRPNQVWCADITYVPLERSFLYLVAIMDWASRKVLAWRLSNTLDTACCVEALEEALARHGRPEIFNTDQGAQFTAVEFTARLQAQQIAISMDGKGRWMDNVFIERLWRSLKYECVYLRAFANGLQAKQDIGHWMSHYNTDRPHSVFQGHTPDEIYYRLLDREEGPDRKGQPQPSAA